MKSSVFSSLRFDGWVLGAAVLSGALVMPFNSARAASGIQKVDEASSCGADPALRRAEAASSWNEATQATSSLGVTAIMRVCFVSSDEVKRIASVAHPA